MIEIINKLLEISGSFVGLLFGTEEFKKLKIVISFISLTFSILILLYYFYLEKKYKIGTSIIITNLKNFLEAFIKKDNFNKNWLKIKDIFILDHKIALKKVLDYLNEIISLYEYEGENLKDKFSKFPESVFQSKSNFIKALSVIEILTKKNENNNISKKEALAIIRIIEKGLMELLIIDSQAQWAVSLVLPED
ncbi:MAG: hypothetical protein KatS3mg095_0167 [Candidatus Parcubacteria bacterium]|nr:MAG: hypothetical protein KatS3mg095_0167 [Candidatus Parcubacteria bacterium]